MAKSNEPHTEEEQERNRMRSIDISEVNAPLKSAKVLVGRGQRLAKVDQELRQFREKQ